MIAARGVYTSEANEEAEEIIHKVCNLVDIVGKNTRTIKNEGVMALYALTK